MHWNGVIRWPFCNTASKNMLCNYWVAFRTEDTSSHSRQAQFLQSPPSTEALTESRPQSTLHNPHDLERTVIFAAWMDFRHFSALFATHCPVLNMCITLLHAKHAALPLSYGASSGKGVMGHESCWWTSCRLSLTLHQTAHGNSHNAQQKCGHTSDLEHKLASANASVRAAFVHVIGDLFQSISVLISALIIFFQVSFLKFIHLHSN